MRINSLMTLLALAMAVPTAAAQDYALPWYSFDGGGDDVGTAGDYTLSGTIGQHDASMAGLDTNTGQYTNEGGYWPEPPIALKPCSVADLVEPFGELNFNDVVAYLTEFAAGCPE